MSEPTAYLVAPEPGLFEWAEHLCHRLGWSTYNPMKVHGTEPVPAETRFQIDMHNLATHVDAVVTLPDWETTPATHGTVLIAQALGLPVWVLSEHPDPEVAFVLVDINVFDADELAAAKERHPAGKKIEEERVNAEPEIVNAPSVREVFEQAFSIPREMVEECPADPIAVVMAAMQSQIGYRDDGACEEQQGTDHDPVNHPSHYTKHPSGVECIQITEWFNFNIGNAIKYLWRAGEKGDRTEDLRKAAWYVNREIEKAERS